MKEKKGKGFEKEGKWFCSKECLNRFEGGKISKKGCCCCH